MLFHIYHLSRFTTANKISGNYAAFCASLTKAETRSDKDAPFSTQALTRSKSKRKRSALPVANGLKKPTRSIKRPSRGERLSATTI
ncbi:unknown [Pasteurella multocida subsp. multocida str. Pm70]|uniref:Uncharacterized protein PM1295 n=1 Tax=Pasteurella multocida (strain Pm70) TaxID=272843 RepID=Y1295_PASMU|nr:RecName: Full=Uncharacterized protein PM1295 [Pasteurella multocida subsp. multocida str. Pm70]AAK03379.1 unknown [Pasteurella multocida subsp. multocida str. Pm70]